MLPLKHAHTPNTAHEITKNTSDFPGATFDNSIASQSAAINNAGTNTSLPLTLKPETSADPRASTFEELGEAPLKKSGTEYTLERQRHLEKSRAEDTKTRQSLPDIEISSHVIGWWLYKDDTTTSEMPAEFVNNQIHNALENPNYNFVLKTDDVERTSRSFPDKLPTNLNIEHEDFALGEQFPKTEMIARGIVSQIPQLSKDILSYKHFQKQSGLMIDPDTRIGKIPFPLKIKSNAAINNLGENNVFAYSGKKRDAMTALLQTIEANAEKVFKIKHFEDETAFVPLPEMDNDKVNVVNALEFNDYRREMKNDDIEDLKKYVEYKTPPSSYAYRGDSMIFSFDVQRKTDPAV